MLKRMFFASSCWQHPLFYSYYYYAVTPFEFGGLLRAIEVILELYSIYVMNSLEPSFVA
jgi:hypothetical protein